MMNDTMTLEDFLALATEFRNLGDAVGSQLRAVAEDPSLETIDEQNPNALKMCLELLTRLSDFEVVGAAELWELVDQAINDH